MMKFNAIILGAGINGCGIANILSQNDKKVLVIDKSTIASGTSSKSSRLIHGGLRYLENFEFSLVKESLRDRNRLVEKYPDLVEMKKFYLPVGKNSKRNSLTIKLGLKLYDFLSANYKYISGKISKKEFLKISDGFQLDNIKNIYYYYDAVTDDKSLTQKIANEAKKNGSEILENYEIDNINFQNDIILDEKYSTNLLINATGPWINEVCNLYKIKTNYKINKVSGIHIEIDKLLSAEPMILEAEDNRIFFVIPNGKNTIVGTTERTERKSCDEIEIYDEDIKYLTNLIDNYFDIEEYRIINQWIGIRPLIESKENLSKVSRDYILEVGKVDKNVILNVFGGKLTTFHSLSKKVYKKLKQEIKW